MQAGFLTPGLSGFELELVRRNALRLYKMVNSLLDFSRVEAGRAQASFVPTDLAAFTAHLVSHFRSAAESAGQSRILLVDDNADLRAYGAALLGRVFSKVETATHGGEALAMIQAQLPDLVVSDVMMPVMDGFALVRALRADERTRSLPIILLSARGRRVHRGGAGQRRR